jgi:protein phosphatase
MLIVESAGLTDIGRKRKVNQDCFAIDDALGLYIVADGMGGHAAGEVASREAAETVLNHTKSITGRRKRVKSPGGYRRLSRQANRLLAGMTAANQHVYDMAHDDRRYTGMGTTVSAVFLSDRGFIAANVGDSPIFLIRGDTIEMVSKLHTVASAATVANPQGQVLGKAFKHILTRAIGTKKNVAPDTTERRCRAGDTIVIASDGLTDMVPAEQIRDAISGAKAAEACERLVALANERGGADNITVIVINIQDVKTSQNVFSRLGAIFGRKK